MTLGAGLEDADGVRHEMAGLLGLETSFAKRKLHLGYRQGRLFADCAIGRNQSRIFGHEFHYASVLAVNDDPLLDLVDAAGAPIAGERLSPRLRNGDILPRHRLRELVRPLASLIGQRTRLAPQFVVPAKRSRDLKKAGVSICYDPG